jgi:hypothetical protein
MDYSVSAAGDKPHDSPNLSVMRSTTVCQAISARLAVSCFDYRLRVKPATRGTKSSAVGNCAISGYDAGSKRKGFSLKRGVHDLQSPNATIPATTNERVGGEKKHLQRLHGSILPMADSEKAFPSLIIGAKEKDDQISAPAARK